MKEDNTELDKLVKELIYTDKYNMLIQKLASWCIFIWIITPLIISFFNLLGMNEVTVTAIWSMIMSIIGGFSIGLGIVFLLNRTCRVINRGFKDILIDLIPLVLLGAFLIWAFVCSLLAENRYEAFMGNWRREGFFAYLSYSGFLFLGLVVSSNTKCVKKLARMFVGVALILSGITIMDNDLTMKMCYYPHYTSTPHYQSVFFNINHFAYYLLIALLITFFLYLYEVKTKIKLLYIGAYFLLLSMLIINNTLGDYLALLVTLIFVLIWKFINSEQNKRKVVLFLLLFFLFSLISIIYTPNVYNNFKSVFGEIKILEYFFSGSVQEDALSTLGSSRGFLWSNAMHFIAQSPIFGYGIENANDLYLSVGTTVGRPHNIFIQMALFTGIPGLMLYVSAFFAGGIRLIKNRKGLKSVSKSAAFIVVGYMMSAFFGNSMFYTSPYFMIVFGVCASNCLRKLDIVIEGNGEVVEKKM